ncbi:hypothetical protein NDU88_007441 [Pleurodeles waltl]|uniref:Uncharacterized protein n=1 Tax=Pleurodeles waltl TaxID=8319 RepID=A0AAV7PPX7_PLEWA|nr:hypothetical protein NDU88_007441 [Pleurodeles waltl]
MKPPGLVRSALEVGTEDENGSRPLRLWAGPTCRTMHGPMARAPAASRPRSGACLSTSPGGITRQPRLALEAEKGEEVAVLEMCLKTPMGLQHRSANWRGSRRAEIPSPRWCRPGPVGRLQ